VFPTYEPSDAPLRKNEPPLLALSTIEKIYVTLLVGIVFEPTPKLPLTYVPQGPEPPERFVRLKIIDPFEFEGPAAAKPLKEV
jgi:hypothetical protein